MENEAKSIEDWN